MITEFGGLVLFCFAFQRLQLIEMLGISPKTLGPDEEKENGRSRASTNQPPSFCINVTRIRVQVLC